MEKELAVKLINLLVNNLEDRDEKIELVNEYYDKAFSMTTSDYDMNAGKIFAMCDFDIEMSNYDRSLIAQMVSGNHFDIDDRYFTVSFEDEIVSITDSDIDDFIRNEGIYNLANGCVDYNIDLGNKDIRAILDCVCEK